MGTIKKWKTNIRKNCIIQEVINDNLTDEQLYYGGDLICESVWDNENASLIAAAPDLLEALQSIENDANTIPESIWKMRNDAIKKAKSLEPVVFQKGNFQTITGKPSKNILLTRDNLIINSKDKTIDQIEFCDFKGRFDKASLIIFIDDNMIKVLKNIDMYPKEGIHLIK